MIDDKKLASAAMNAEELDQVAGGTFEEGKQDALELEKVFGYNVRFSYRTGIGDMRIYDHNAVREAFAKFGVKVNYDSDKSNEYFIGGNKVTREEAWNHINSIVDKKTN